MSTTRPWNHNGHQGEEQGWRGPGAGGSHSKASRAQGARAPTGQGARSTGRGRDGTRAARSASDFIVAGRPRGAEGRCWRGRFPGNLAPSPPERGLRYFRKEIVPWPRGVACLAGHRGPGISRLKQWPMGAGCVRERVGEFSRGLRTSGVTSRLQGNWLTGAWCPVPSGLPSPRGVASNPSSHKPLCPPRHALAKHNNSLESFGAPSAQRGPSPKARTPPS